MQLQTARLSVLGAGSWGTVLAQLLANNGHQVVLWTRHEAQARHINQERKNPRYMSELSLADKVGTINKVSRTSKAVKMRFQFMADPGFSKRVCFHETWRMSQKRGKHENGESGSDRDE